MDQPNGASNGTSNDTSNETTPMSSGAPDTNNRARAVFDSSLRAQWRAHVRDNHISATEHVSDMELDTIFNLHGVVSCSWLFYRLAFYTYGAWDERTRGYYDHAREMADYCRSHFVIRHWDSYFQRSAVEQAQMTADEVFDELQEEGIVAEIADRQLNPRRNDQDPGQLSRLRDGFRRLQQWEPLESTGQD
ncbi:hypothetical protein BDY17DRAFT_350850 [Neohortaea acidophila]|uniref:Uncharacterized protein n=1 Tax=Neohortaea acidophila TaxID=245834 RepID=A0A6A6Q6N8_9PEZI|nr:uncharacterized protein BDY17DRAFT_350850 [Neohortaea acidophila]KAF2488108.1 hypothetical protein BDY17DRAFT_350850 [Neohortaea acidophila]